MNWTIDDMLAGRCNVTQVGTEREEEPDAVEGNGLGTVEDYLAIHEALGGRKFLMEWARANPAKFYDQLLKILEKTEAIKRAGDEGKRLEELTGAELEKLSSAEIKRLLLSDRGT